MNKTSRDKKFSARRLVALLLCCFCLLAALPVAALADTDDDALILDAAVTEEQPQAESDLVVEEAPALTFYDRLMSAVSCWDIYALLTADENQADALALTGEQLDALTARAWELGDDGSLSDLLAALNALMSPAESVEYSQEEEYVEEDYQEEDEQPEEPQEDSEDEYVEESEPEEEYEEEPEEEVEDEFSAEAAAEELYWRLMNCDTLDEMNEILNNLTEEEEALLDLFTDEQNEALEEKMAQLGAYGVDTLTDRSYTIEQGGTQTVSINNMTSDFSYSCNPSADITATINSQQNGWSTSYTGYTITVGDNVSAGTYTLTVTYNTRSGWSYIQQTDTVTITVTAKDTTKNTFTVTPYLTNVDAIYVAFNASNAASITANDFRSMTDGEAVSIENHNATETGYFVVFVKPDDNYLLTSAAGSGNSDVYSITEEFGNIKDYPDIDRIADLAEELGYIGLLGWMRAPNYAVSGMTVSTTLTAYSPDIEVAATVDKSEGVKPGDELTFTVTITPGTISGTSATVTGVEIDSLTINGTTVSYSNLTQNRDGTYTATVTYTATEDDCNNASVRLDVTANVSYAYELGVSDSQTLNSSATITKSASTTCLIAPKNSVIYSVSYEPSDLTRPDAIKTKPANHENVYQGTVIDVDSTYGQSPVFDSANGGEWTFNGWYLNADYSGSKVTSVTMGTDTIYLYGKWTFERKTTTVTITKLVNGNMGNWGEEFTFTVSGNTYTEEVTTFKLKHNESKELTVNIGDEVTVTETESGYSVSYEITAEGYTPVSGSGNSVTYTVTSAADQTITFTNTHEVTLDTGVLLDTLPYIIILVIVAAGAVLMLKKRSRRED